MRNGWLAGLLFLAGCGGSSGGDSGGGPSTAATPQSLCVSLNGQVFSTPDGNATVVSTSFNSISGNKPEHCQVLGSIPPALHFEMRLPSQWNQRVLYMGGGGFDGVIPLPHDLGFSQGYVTVGSDGGHPLGVDESWAFDTEKLNDYAYRSVHKTLTAARLIMQQRYGQGAVRTYFEGCSNGGREALIQAQRYPNDFDGVIARAPAWNIAELMLAGNKSMQQFFASVSTQLSSAKVATLSNAVLAACDGLDNLQDGIIGNAAACQFNPMVLRCAGADNDACLTDAQITTVNTLYAVFRFSNNVPYYIGWPAGGESDPVGWSAWVASQSNGLPSYSTRFIRYFLLNDPNYDPMIFVPENHLPEIVNRATLLDASATDYSMFRARNGKLILWHGTNDWAISFNSTALYYRDVVTAAGTQAAADQFVEFFPAPGVQHCGGGSGPDLVDLLTPLKNWVENGIAPSQQNMTSFKVNWSTLAITNTRPLCKYPRYPRYVGSGDPNAASSFACTL